MNIYKRNKKLNKQCCVTNEIVMKMKTLKSHLKSNVKRFRAPICFYEKC